MPKEKLPRLTHYSGKRFAVEFPDGTKKEIVPDEEQQKLLDKMINQEFPKEEADDYNVHRIIHDLHSSVEEGQGWEYMEAIEKWAEKYPDEVIHCGVDDNHFASSDIYLIPHRSRYRHMGATVLYIPQCTGEKPIQFFCYPGHLDGLIKGLQKIRDHLLEVPERDTKSPRYKKVQKLKRNLMKTVKWKERFGTKMPKWAKGMMK